jgi:hypothetical protein
MTKATLIKILDQLYQAQSQGLIHDYSHNCQYLYQAHQHHLAKIPKPPPRYSLFITFHPNTPQSKKIALKDYFISTYHTNAYLTLEESVLRVNIPKTQTIKD